MKKTERDQRGRAGGGTFHRTFFESLEGRFLLTASAAGTLDFSFAPAALAQQNSLNLRSVGAALTNDGKMIEAAVSGGESGATGELDLVRYNADGSLDPTFGTAGVVRVPGGPTTTDNHMPVLVQPDGKFLVGGAVPGPGSYPMLATRFCVMRFTSQGTPDPTFGANGRVTTAFAVASGSEIHALGFGPDGTILAAGNSGGLPVPASPYFNTPVVVARYLPNGALDHAFGHRGRMTFSRRFPDPTTSSEKRAEALVVLPSGKFLVAGSSNSVATPHVGRFNVIRFNANGSLDRSFGRDGQAMAAVGTIGAGAEALLVQPDGRIVAGGYSFEAGNAYAGAPHFCAVRFTQNGALDPTFGQGGIAELRQQGAINATLALADGKLIVAGSSDRGQATFVRLLPDGSLDPTFGPTGTPGTLSILPGGTDTDAPALMAGPRGTILAPVASTNVYDAVHGNQGVPALNPNSQIHAFRLTADGALDATFAGGGVTKTSIAAADVIDFNDVATQPDGKVIVAAANRGHFANGSGDDFVARYDADGTRDASFGAGGTLAPPPGASSEVKPDGSTARPGWAQSVAVQNDGKILVGGVAARVPGDPQGMPLLLARYNADGSLDTTFGNAGTLTTALGRLSIGGDLGLAVSHLAIRADGTFVAYVDAGFNPDGIATFTAYLATFSPQGTLLNSVLTAENQSSEEGPDQGVLAVAPDGKVVTVVNASFSYTTPGPPVLIQRFNPDLTPDTTFDGGQVVPGIALVNAAAVQPDGKVLVGGRGHDGHFRLVRYNVDGTPDTTFGFGGVASTIIGAGAQVQSLALQPDGKILAGGNTLDAATNIAPPQAFRYFVLARYNADGSLDPTFGTGLPRTPVPSEGGFFAVQFSPGPGVVLSSAGGSNRVDRLALTPDGQLLMAGTSTLGGMADLAASSTIVLAKYHT